MPSLSDLPAYTDDIIDLVPYLRDRYGAFDDSERHNMHNFVTNVAIFLRNPSRNQGYIDTTPFRTMFTAFMRWSVHMGYASDYLLDDSTQRQYFIKVLNLVRGNRYSLSPSPTALSTSRSSNRSNPTVLSADSRSSSVSRSHSPLVNRAVSILQEARRRPFILMRKSLDYYDQDSLTQMAFAPKRDYYRVNGFSGSIYAYDMLKTALSMKNEDPNTRQPITKIDKVQFRLPTYEESEDIRTQALSRRLRTTRRRSFGGGRRY